MLFGMSPDGIGTATACHVDKLKAWNDIDDIVTFLAVLRASNPYGNLDEMNTSSLSENHRATPQCKTSPDQFVLQMAESKSKQPVNLNFTVLWHSSQIIDDHTSSYEPNPQISEDYIGCQTSTVDVLFYQFISLLTECLSCENHGIHLL